eukprot:CAMPEP_0174975852 /NCGR_PEP_ID=MMETSP0004_2-20121128/12680_1 /TAXON_ID=420556 /ORGANISM="Ochromonas sp., Strain CCMP1393" /LENGTH=90 /DNA_ID=CAMNT_0016226763 /DNA_START=214 /DNA_END=487 /DNA_ORIENTATION=+
MSLFEMAELRAKKRAEKKAALEKKAKENPEAIGPNGDTTIETNMINEGTYYANSISGHVWLIDGASPTLLLEEAYQFAYCNAYFVLRRIV